MCGVAGILSQSAITKESICDMSKALVHRGPDDSGYWVDESYAVALIHRRLAIQDLSESGHQPMTSHCGRYVIVFNGEIYNQLDIRKQLEFNEWRGHSDTETLLAAVSELGLESTLARLVGMFAFALWDREARELVLARDRFGEKPLYYGWQDNVFLFGSELKSLKRHAAFKSEVDRSSIALYMENGYIPGPSSIYRGIKKLSRGSWLKVSFEHRDLEPVPYWNFTDVASHSQQHIVKLDDTRAIETLEALLTEAICSQKISDVPIGAFLSGGVDSSTIVALMQRDNITPVNTFALGYSDQRFNEANYAKQVADHLGTNHTELYVTHDDAISVLPDLPKIYCEPFADSSQIPTYLVSKLASQHVKVALSGDAGDELFGGYNHYTWVTKLWPRISWLPQPVRHLVASGLMILPPGAYNNALCLLQNLSRKNNPVFTASNRIETLARFMKSGSMTEAYFSLVANREFSKQVVLGEGIETPSIDSGIDSLDDMHQMMYLDSDSFLTDDILVKTDRAAMSVGLETRIPMLDSRVVDFIWSQPLRMKIRNGQRKWLLRQVLSKYVPDKIIERPKMGFGVPIDEWLRDPLLDWAENLLDKSKIDQQGYLNSNYVRKLWDQHRSSQYNWSKPLWSILMFQAWLDTN